MQSISLNISRSYQSIELENEYDIVILGGGPAGLTASIYASRAKLNTLLIEKEIPVEGVFIYVGLNPNAEYVYGQVELNKWGYIITDQKMQTSLPGVFAAGDIRQTEIRQVATAIGDGAVAANSAQHFIEQYLGDQR